jgi:tRNA nucleotidyltransferase/poly(A) polymerase
MVSQRAIAWERVPAPIRALVATLEAAGYEAALVGGCVRDLARGAPVHDWDVATSAELPALLALFSTAVPIGARFGTVMVPTPAGPVDVTHHRGGGGLPDDLRLRDFTINALALCPGAAAPLDPCGGLPDLAAGRLRAVGSAAERLAEDPLRALRAARLVAELDLAVDPELERALPAVAPALADVAAERVRAELERALVAPRAGRAIALLRRTGLEAVLVPGAQGDAAAVVDALAADLVARLAAWLRGTQAPALLARLRTPASRARDVETLLALHPLDEHVPPAEPALRRLLRRVQEANTARLLALREAEIAVGAAPPEAPGRLAALREALARVRSRGALALVRADLAIGGREVMELLGCGPGPRVGRALAHLTECVLDEPERNTPEALCAMLRAWAEAEGDEGGTEGGAEGRAPRHAGGR